MRLWERSRRDISPATIVCAPLGLCCGENRPRKFARGVYYRVLTVSYGKLSCGLLTFLEIAGCAGGERTVRGLPGRRHLPRHGRV